MAGLTDEEAEMVRKWLAQHLVEHEWSGPTDPGRFGDGQEVWQRDGTLVRLTRNGGGWTCDLSRRNAQAWLDLGRMATAMGSPATAPVERVADLCSTLNDRVFGALSATLPHSP